MVTRLLRIASIGILVLTVSAQADDKRDDFRLDVVPATPAKPFAKGTNTLEFEGSYTTPIRYSVEEFATVSVGVGYYIFDNHSVTLFAQGFHVNQAFGESTEAGAVFVLGRSILYNLDKFSFYIDGGGGYSWANAAVPIGGTTYNFNARAGLGLAYRLADATYLMGGARYFHLSNAQQHGKEKNPSYDGIEYYVGVMFAFH
jgi:hypothetical protein